ncbi:MAG TPA: PQQ-binding-like beta-propeller repeat protein [Pirellulales bacterium]|nr:PQQ-binding-like beta-propeller repeat protein [Pirellulales bacterium]
MSDDSNSAEAGANPAPTPAKTTWPAVRLWPGIAVVVALWAVRIWGNTGEASRTKFFVAFIIAPLAATVGLLMWWLLFSRVRWSDRALLVGVYAALAAATVAICGEDFPPMALMLYALPAVASAWVGWLTVSTWMAWPWRRTLLIGALTLTFGAFTLLRVDGMDGAFRSTFNWRWTPTPEETLLADLSRSPEPASPTVTEYVADEIELQPGDWPGFRGANRDGRVIGIAIATDWKQTPPKQLWSRRIGPGWSSFAVVGKRLFTQEQRGDEELVVCYDADTGDERWRHAEQTRFTEVVAGPGPRGTPQFHDGKIYAQGANGTLSCLDAATGKALWTQDIAKDSGAKLPQWGFSGSPLVAHGLVTVFAGGPSGKSVLAYDAESGKLAWTAGEGMHSYASTQAATLGGVEQLLMATDTGLISLDPESGKAIWTHDWKTDEVPRIVQPAVLNESDILIGTGMGFGTRRIRVAHDGSKWPIEEVWTSKQFKPYYNDFVVYGDQLYGFDGPIFLCFDIKQNKVRWRVRGYGNGQVLLLADQGLLLVLAETGEAALVEAQPKKRVELSRIEVVSGKTWNHPVIAHGRLYVRNGEEMACFELPIAATAEPAE